MCQPISNASGTPVWTATLWNIKFLEAVLATPTLVCMAPFILSSLLLFLNTVARSLKIQLQLQSVSISLAWMAYSTDFVKILNNKIYICEAIVYHFCNNFYCSVKWVLEWNKGPAGSETLKSDRKLKMVGGYFFVMVASPPWTKVAVHFAKFVKREYIIATLY